MNKTCLFCRYKNDIPIVGSMPGMERYYISSEEGVQKLEIRRTRPRDVGVYKCKIYNKMGWTSCDAKLFVEGTLIFDYKITLCIV